MARKKDSGKKKQLEKNKRDKVEADKLGLNLKEYRLQKRSARYTKKTIAKVKKHKCRLTNILNIKKAEEELDREGFTLGKAVMDYGQTSQHYNGYITKKRKVDKR